MPSTWEPVFMPLRKLHFWVLRNSRYNWAPPAWGLKSERCCLRCLRTSHGLPWARSILSSMLISLEAEYSDFSNCSWLSSQISWLGQMNHVKKEELSKVKKIIWKASTLGHHLYDTCSIATKFLPWGCLAECPVWRHSHWRHSAELRWQARSSACSPARSLLKTSLWHCNQQCVKKTDRKTAQAIDLLFASRKSWRNKSKSVYLLKVLPKIQLSTVEDGVLITEPLVQINWVTACNAGCMRKKTYFPNSLCKQKPIQNSIAQGLKPKSWDASSDAGHADPWAHHKGQDCKGLELSRDSHDEPWLTRLELSNWELKQSN